MTDKEEKKEEKHAITKGGLYANLSGKTKGFTIFIIVASIVFIAFIIFIILRKG